MTFGMALGAYALFLVIYWLFVAVIVWHAKQYTTKKDYSATVVKAFFIISILLTMISLVLFFKLPLTY